MFFHILWINNSWLFWCGQRGLQSALMFLYIYSHFYQILLELWHSRYQLCPLRFSIFLRRTYFLFKIHHLFLEKIAHLCDIAISKLYLLGNILSILFDQFGNLFNQILRLRIILSKLLNLYTITNENGDDDDYTYILDFWFRGKFLLKNRIFLRMIRHLARSQRDLLFVLHF